MSMNTETDIKTAGTPPIASSDLLGARPKLTNAEYLRKWRRENPDKYRAQHDRNEAIKAERYHEQNKRTHRDECKCVECGIIYKRDDAILRGFRFLKNAGNKVICDECA